MPKSENLGSFITPQLRSLRMGNAQLQIPNYKFLD